jgi:hypothetical protein
MDIYTFQDFYITFKKRGKLFIILFILLISASIIANKTFLKDKIVKKYSVVFDYDFHYPYINFDMDSLKFNAAIFDPYSSEEKKRYLPFGNRLSLPFQNLKSLHETYWELLYKYNLGDTKSNSTNNNYYEISNSFKFDTNNFKFRNRKLHLGWNNIEEAEDYLKSLNDRSILEIKKMIKTVHKSNNDNAKITIKNKILMFPPNTVLNNIKKQNNFETDLEVKELVNKNILYFKMRGVSDAQLFKLILSDNVYQFSGADKLSLNGLDFNQYSSLQNSVYVSDKRDMIYYYLSNKFNTDDLSVTDDLDFFPEILELSENIVDFIPKYKLFITKVSVLYIYLIEIILCLLIPFLIIFTFENVRSIEKNIKINRDIKS